MSHEFVLSGEKSSEGVLKDSCLKCGRTLSAHGPPKQQINIYFGGKLWIFQNWEEARKFGFFLVAK